MQMNSDVAVGTDAAGGAPLLTMGLVGGGMARSDRRCPHERCQMHGETTMLSVCRCCHRATVRSIYRPQATIGYRRGTASRSLPAL